MLYSRYLPASHDLTALTIPLLWLRVASWANQVIQLPIKQWAYPPESKSQSNKEQSSLCWLNDFKPRSRSTIVNAIPESVNQSLGSRTTNDHQMTTDYRHSSEGDVLWLHSMNDTNSNCDLGPIIQIIGLVWTRLVSQFIHSLIHWWTNAWRIIIMLSDPWLNLCEL